MHDPLVVAFEIRRPWPTRRGTRGRRYWPALVTVWHREPRGHDSGRVCKEYRSVEQADGTRRTVLLNGWRFHVHHWKLQIHPLQRLRRRLLTRCAWCSGRHRTGDPVDVSMRWDGVRAPWWRGERDLYHHGCGSVASAHRQCSCLDPICSDYSVAHGPYGKCARCGLSRSFGLTPGRLATLRELAAVPAGQRKPVNPEVVK